MATDEPAATPAPVVETPRRGHPAWRVVRRVARALVLIYLGVSVVLYALQTRLIFPASDSRGRPEYRVVPPPGTALVTLTSVQGEPITALFGPALTAQGRPHPRAAQRPTLLYFYGNGTTLKAMTFEHERLRRLGVNVFIPEYLGYGMSGGAPSAWGCHETARAAYEHLRTRDDVDPRLIVAAGWSLGGAVAIELASRRPVAGLFVMSTFTSMTEMAHRSFPFLPTSLLLRHRFESLERIGGLSVPILIGHGDRDEIVPPDMARRLATAATSSPRVESFTVSGAGHNDVFEVRTAETYQRLGSFLDRLAPIEAP